MIENQRENGRKKNVDRLKERVMGKGNERSEGKKEKVCVYGRVLCNLQRKIIARDRKKERMKEKKREIDVNRERECCLQPYKHLQNLSKTIS